MEPIIVSQEFSHSIQKVWNAISQLGQMKQWFFEEIPSFEAREGFHTAFVVRANDRIFTHQWVLIEVIEQQRITYHWSYKEYTGQGTVVFELHRLTDGCVLTVTSHDMESFPQEIPEFSRESCKGGWNYFIKQRLPDYLSTN